MNLTDYIDESKIDYINQHLKKVAVINLEKNLAVNYKEMGIEDRGELKDLTYQESLSLILTGVYPEPVFEMRLNIYRDGFYLGYYQYLTNLNFSFIDEFMVARWK